MKWERSHIRDIDQVDLEGIDRDRRRILSGYVTSSKGYSKKVEELFRDIPDDAMVSVRDILGEMPDDLDDDIMAAIEGKNEFTSQLASIDNGVRPQERQEILQETKAIKDMPEEMQEFYASQADEDFSESLDAVMQH